MNNVICLVFDRLHSGYLGAYGNSWIETPEFDRLASEGFVFDQMLIDSPRLDRLYRSYWLGRHAACPADPSADSLIARLNALNVETVLMTDDIEVADHPLAADFCQRIEIDPIPGNDLADTIEQTQIASCMAQIIDRLSDLPEPFFLWCHVGALGTRWDAPWEFRTRYIEEGDPQQQRSAEVPCRRLSDDEDPDTVVGAYQAYAGQIAVWDACLGALWNVLDETGLAGRSLLALTSARGFPLGEHGHIGPCDALLYGPLVHVPLVLRFPDRLGATARSPALIEPTDLWATLSEWAGLASADSLTGSSLIPLVRGDIQSLRDRLCVLGNGSQRALRTPAWYLREASVAELFAKPDDRWEVNNVADRCGPILESIQADLLKYYSALSCGDLSQLRPLDESLRQGLE